MLEAFSELSRLNKIALLFLALTKVFGISGLLLGFLPEARIFGFVLLCIAAIMLLCCVGFATFQFYMESKIFKKEDEAMVNLLRMNLELKKAKEELKMIKERKLFVQDMKVKLG